MAQIADAEILPEIQALDGVASADLTGGLEQQIMISLDPAKLAADGVTIQQITGVLQANNLTLPSGQLPADGQRIPISTVGRLTSLDQIRSLVVGVHQPEAAPGASPPPGALPTPVTIADVGTVDQVAVATTGYARTNGQPSLTLTVTKTSSGNTVKVAQEVTAKLAEIAAQHPTDISVTTVQDLSTFIVDSQDGLLREGGLGALFAVLTIFLFLFSLRSTFVAAISIPLSVLTALVLMQVADMTLNVMTLGGLAVAVGRVVDDAIVVLENIYRHRAMGEDTPHRGHQGPARGGPRHHRQHGDHGDGLPAHRLRRWPGQPALPALRADRHLRPARVAGLRLDRRARAGLPVHQPRLAQRSTPTASPGTRSGSAIYTPLITRRAAQSLDQVGRARRGRGAVRRRHWPWSARCPTQFINTGSEKILGVTLIPPSGTSSQAVLDRATQAESILLKQPNVKIVQTSVPGEGDTGFSTIVARTPGPAGQLGHADRPARSIGRPGRRRRRRCRRR